MKAVCCLCVMSAIKYYARRQPMSWCECPPTFATLPPRPWRRDFCYWLVSSKRCLYEGRWGLISMTDHPSCHSTPFVYTYAHVCWPVLTSSRDAGINYNRSLSWPVTSWDTTPAFSLWRCLHKLWLQEERIYQPTHPTRGEKGQNPKGTHWTKRDHTLQ